jgi:hypothetical protein
MSHPVVIAAGLLVALLVLAELVAVPLATRLVGDAFGRCVRHGSLTIEQVQRPVVPRLLVGRATGVVLHLEDVELDGLLVAEATVDAPQVVLPWALGDPTPGPATVELRVEEAAVAARLAALSPLGLRPRVDLDHGVARIGVPASRLELTLSLDVDDDGALVLQPGIGPAEWWDRLGLARRIELPSDVRATGVTIDPAAVTATLELDELPGGDGEGCEQPVAADAEVPSAGPPRATAPVVPAVEEDG